MTFYVAWHSCMVLLSTVSHHLCVASCLYMDKAVECWGVSVANRLIFLKPQVIESVSIAGHG